MTVHDAVGRLSPVAPETAVIGFTRDGYVLGDDTLNPVQSRYHVEASGYRADTPTIGGVGFGGSHTRLRLIKAVDSMFFGPIVANVNGNRLTLGLADRDAGLAPKWCPT